MQKKYFISSCIKHFIYVLLILLRDASVIPDVICGLVIMVFALFSIQQLVKDKLVFTPLFIPDWMLFCFGLYSMQLLITVSRMSIEGSLTIILAMFVWNIITVFNRTVFIEPKCKTFNVSVNKQNKMIYTIFIIGAACMILEWWHAGGIPVLRSDAETFRFNVSINGIIHILAIAIKFVPIFIGTYFIYNINETKFPCIIRRFNYIVLFTISILFMFGTAFRGELVFGLVIIFIAAFTYYKPNLIKLIKFVVPVLCVLGIYPIARGYFMYGEAYIASLMKISKYEEYWFLTPIYQTLAFNFEILNRDFAMIPDIVPYGLGSYTVLCYVPFCDLSLKLGKVQNQVWQNGFYANLTATFFGDWYGDYGYIGCVVGACVICLLANSLYKKWIKYGSPKCLIAFSYTFYQTLIMVYSNTFDFVYICYMLMIWLVYKISYKSVFDS